MDQQKEDLRKNIILQYFLEHNHTMPETGRDEDNPQFTLTDVLIHAKLATRDLPRWLSHWDED